MSVDLTWRYLVQFLLAQGPDHLLIPIDQDAHIGWDGHLLTIRAPRQSWLWRTIADVWNPLSWQPIDMEEWWEGHDPFLAQRFSWGHWSQTTPQPSWEEWQLAAHRGFEFILEDLFSSLVARLGARRVRVRWHQETIPKSERLLGLPIRLQEVTLHIVDPHLAGWPSLRPGLVGLKAHMTWEIPRWNSQFANTLVLSRWGQTSRLEAHYRLLDFVSGHEASHRAFRQERHVLPIFRWYPVKKSPISRSWHQTVQRARNYQRLDRLATFLASHPWPQLGVDEALPARLRFDRSIWHRNPIHSQPGTSVYTHRSGPEVMVFWPQGEHPGYVSIQWSATSGSRGIEILDPLRTIVRETKNWRYWAWLITEHVMPLVEEWVHTSLNSPLKGSQTNA